MWRGRDTQQLAELGINLRHKNGTKVSQALPTSAGMLVAGRYAEMYLRAGFRCDPSYV